jgi:hypothetical protein
MKSLVSSLIIGSLALAIAPRPSLATSYTGTGSDASFRSQTGVHLGTVFDANTLFVRISAGLPGKVLVVRATVAIQNPATTVEPYMQLYTNAAGTTSQPEPTGPAAIEHKCTDSCIVTMEWWIDLDAAEAGCPGCIYGQTLTETLLLFDELAPRYTVGPSTDISLSAQLVSKN